jgi:phage-related protein (TIGR01555 family)
VGALLKLRQVRDGLRNLVSAVGTPKDKSANWSYAYSPLDAQTIDAMYASSWLSRKIIDIIPQDMTREWRTWQFDDAEDVYKLERTLKLRQKLKKALILGRLYGGGAILMGDGAADPTEPLDVADIEKDGLDYLHVFSRYDITPEGFISDIGDEDYGKPEFYRITVGSRRTTEDFVRIHRSRFVFFPGLEYPSMLFSRDMGEWGIPIYDSIFQAIVNAESTPANAAALVEDAKVDYFKIPDLMSYLSDEESTRRLVERFSLANTLKSTVNAMIIGGDEEFERKQTSLAGFTDLIQVHLQIAAGAADVPVTRLLGQSPAGLNATGDSDLRNYYDKVRSHQQTDLVDAIERLDEAVVRSATGDYPDEATYEWNPLWQMDANQKATIFKTRVEGVVAVNNTGLIAPEELRPAFINMLVDDGTLGTIDQNLLPDDEALGLNEPDPVLPPIPGQTSGQPGQPESPGVPGAPGPGGDLTLIQGGRTDGKRVITDSTPRTLYLRRNVKNAADLRAWAKSQNLAGVLGDDDEPLHVTTAYSRAPIDWMKLGDDLYGDGSGEITISTGGPRVLEQFGQAVALLFTSDILKWRWEQVKSYGGVWDYPEYQPHVTVANGVQDLSRVEPYQGEIVLGPEIFSEISDEASYVPCAGGFVEEGAL